MAFDTKPPTPTHPLGKKTSGVLSRRRFGIDKRTGGPITPETGYSIIADAPLAAPDGVHFYTIAKATNLANYDSRKHPDGHAPM